MNEITKFDPVKFSSAINDCIKNGVHKDKIITNQGDICHILADVLGCDSDTVRKWSYPKSNGPQDPTWVNTLERELNVSLRMSDSDFKIQKEADEVFKDNYNEYAKKSIGTGYILMKKYITSPEVDSEERLVEFWEEFNYLRVSIPTPVFNKMEQFAKDNFDPIIYDSQKIFSDNTLETFLMTIGVIENKLV